MARVKRGNVHKNKRRRILKKAKGYYGSDSRLYASARDAVDHAMQYAYVGRKRKKRDFRRLWIIRINRPSMLGEAVRVDKAPRMEGRLMSMIITPKRD